MGWTSPSRGTDEYWYNVYTLGNWGILGDVIFTNWTVENLSDQKKHFDNIRNGLDCGRCRERPGQRSPRQVTDEIATAMKDIDIFTGWLKRLENPDPVLQTESSGKGIKLYDEVSRDPHASAVLQSRYLSVVGKEWEIIDRKFIAFTYGSRLADFNQASLKGIADGTALRDFRKDFDSIVQRHGWKYKGGKAWRTGVIFNTNLRTAYAAGHHEIIVMMDPDVLKACPYWRYVPSGSKEPRAEHAQWYNLVLPHDDPFWQTHRPPNGWGCKCGLVNHRQSTIRKENRQGNPRGNPHQRDHLGGWEQRR